MNHSVVIELRESTDGKAVIAKDALRVAVTALPAQTGASSFHPVLTASPLGLKTAQDEANSRYWELGFDHPSPAGTVLGEDAFQKQDQLGQDVSGVQFTARVQTRLSLPDGSFGWFDLV